MGAGRAAPTRPAPPGPPGTPPRVYRTCLQLPRTPSRRWLRRPGCVSSGAARAGGQHAVYFNFSESFLGALPAPLLNADEPLGGLGRMWFRALFSFANFFLFFFLLFVSPLTLSGRVPCVRPGVPVWWGGGSWVSSVLGGLVPRRSWPRRRPAEPIPSSLRGRARPHRGRHPHEGPCAAPGVHSPDGARRGTG